MLDPASGSFSISLAGCIYVPAGLYKGEEINHKKNRWPKTRWFQPEVCCVVLLGHQSFFSARAAAQDCFIGPRGCGNVPPTLPLAGPYFSKRGGVSESGTYQRCVPVSRHSEAPGVATMRPGSRTRNSRCDEAGRKPTITQPAAGLLAGREPIARRDPETELLTSTYLFACTYLYDCIPDTYLACMSWIPFSRQASD